MSAEKRCCGEYRCMRSQPFKIRRAPFTRRIVLLTRYTTKAGNLITASQKHDITEEIEAFARSEGWIIPEKAE